MTTANNNTSAMTVPGRAVHKVLVVVFYWTPEHGVRLLLVRHTLSGEFAPISGTVDVTEADYAGMNNDARERANTNAAIRESREELGLNLVSLDPATTTKYFYQTPSLRKDIASTMRRDLVFKYRVYFTDVTQRMFDMTPPSVRKKGPTTALQQCEAMVVKAIGRQAASTAPRPDYMKEVDGAKFVSLEELRGVMRGTPCTPCDDVVLWDQFERLLCKWPHFQSYFAEKLPNFASTRNHSGAWPSCPKFYSNA
jgi:8-oxo-dGTP pyrophosphatase MutT (NUDIX family)